MPSHETKTCHACRERLKWDWEVCPFCGAPQDRFDQAAAAVPQPDTEALSPDEFEPAENEQVDRQPLPPIVAAPLAPDSLPSGDVPYAIMRTDTGRMNVPEIGRRLSAILGRPMADITCRIQSSRRFLARNVPLTSLAEIAGLLASFGIAAVAVPEHEIAPLPPPYRTARVIRDGAKLLAAATSPEGITWRLAFSPDQVRLVVTGRVMYTVRITTEEPRYDHFARSVLFRKRYVKPEDAVTTRQKEVHGYDYEVFLFLRDPERLLLIRDAQLDYRKMQRLPSDPQRMREQAELLARALPPSVHDDALRMLALLDEDDPQWTPFTFATQKGFEACAEACLNFSRLEIT